jgi:hypothetical protein
VLFKHEHDVPAEALAKVKHSGPWDRQTANGELYALVGADLRSCPQSYPGRLGDVTLQSDLVAVHALQSTFSRERRGFASCLVGVATDFQEQQVARC